MSLLLNPVDVFKAAIILEQRGVEFYADAAGQSEGQSKNLLLKLSEMEKGHAKRFSDLLKNVEAHDRPHVSTNDVEEEKAFLAALTSDRIITDEIKFNSDDSLETILLKAMQLEKNSVFFYSAVKETLQRKMNVADIDQLIAEEVRHFHALNQALQKIQGKN
jgi:rubrerythrin